MPIDPSLVSNAEIVINGTAATGGSSVTPSINVFCYQRTSVFNVLAKTPLYNIFNTTVIAPLLAAANIRYTVNNVSIRWLDDPHDAPAVNTNAGVGAIATDSLPSDAAVFYLFRTAKRGKSFRGGKHFSPASEIDTTNDLLTGAGLARWVTLKAALFAQLTDTNGNVWVPAVYSRFRSDPTHEPVASIEANPVTEVLLDLNIGTMRKRRSKTVR